MADTQQSSLSGLVVPVVVWGKNPPRSPVTCATFLTDKNTIITGSENGHITIWKCLDDSITPVLMMIGHDTAISALTSSSCSPTTARFISCSVDGHLCLWDIMDGRCVDSLTSVYTHRNMKPYSYKASRHTRVTRIFCSGDYSDILVLDPQDLTIVFNVSSRVEPDWLNSFSFISRAGKPDSILGVSVAGIVKVWRLVDLDQKNLAVPLYEDESKRLVNDVNTSSFSPTNDRLLLVVSSYLWQTLDIDDLSVSMSYECSVKAVTGAVLAIDKVAVAFVDHSLVIYQLPLEMLSGDLVRAQFGTSPKNYLGAQKPIPIAVLEGCATPGPLMSLNRVLFAFSPQKDDEVLWQVARATPNGSVLVWKIPRYDHDFMSKFTSQSQLPLKYKGTFEESLESVWSAEDDDQKPFPVMDDGNTTCSLFVGQQGKLMLGRGDGVIVMTYACETLSRQLLEVSQEKPTARKLFGHTAAVRALCYPAEHHPRFDLNLLLSGADDFSVIAWNMSTSVKLYRFSVHGGPISRFLIPPANTSKNMSKCVCVVAADHSVSMLNVRDMKCALFASRHPHAVKEVKWRPLDDFMLVRLDDGSVYVWQMETANIDRVVSGLVAEEVMSACDEQIGRDEGTDEAAASNAVQLMRAIRHKNIAVVKNKIGGGNDARDASDNGVGGSALDLGYPMSVIPLPGCDSGAHLVQFEVSSLIGGIVNVDASDEASTDPAQLQKADDANSIASLSRRLTWQFEANLFMDAARLMLSLLHGWNLDVDLDTICDRRLGLHKPKKELYFGNISRHGQLSVVLPQRNRRSFDVFSTQIRWQAGHSLTTSHLLAIIATANTLMGMKHADIQINRNRKSVAAPIQKQMTREALLAEKQQMKQGWSLVAALHCVLLPDYVRPKSSYAAPRIELLARRWQDSCLEVREAAQALLIRELTRLGPKGRRRLVESWAPFLPPLLDGSLSIFGPRLQSSIPSVAPNAPPPIPPRQSSSPPTVAPMPEGGASGSGEDESGVQQVRRNQATSIILLGLMGSEFGEELNRADLTRATAQSLLELLVAAPSNLLPVHSPLRRAAIDLLGRGFVYWEAHLEISKVLLGLLDLAASSTKQTMPQIVGAPLSPIADACRTARHALSLIATARPPALLTALSMEVARYNSAAQHQTIQHTVVSPLLKSRSEVLRLVDELSEKKYSDVVEMMLPVGDVLVHCLDTTLLKQKSLGDIFPPIAKFHMVGYCSSSRRIAFGACNGTVVVHELRAAKATSLQAHNAPVTAVAFSEDGKYLATYSANEGKLCFFQTSQSFLGMGQSTLRIAKTLGAPSEPVQLQADAFKPRLVWINNKCVSLLLNGGKEQRFAV